MGEIRVFWDKPVLSILSPKEIKIIFYLTAKELTKVSLGDIIQAVCVDCDTSVEGKIIFISPQAEYTPPLIFSNDTNAKLVYRVEASYSQQKAVVHPGQPVTVHYGYKRRAISN